MSLKKSYCLLFVLLLIPLVLVGVVQSVGPPEIHLSAGSSSVYVYGSGWQANTNVPIYYDMIDANHMVALATTSYHGSFQVSIPTDYIPTVGFHTIIAGWSLGPTATADYQVQTTSPPDDRLLNPILAIQNKLNDVGNEIQAVETKLDAGGSFYNFVDTWFGTVDNKLDTVDGKLDNIANITNKLDVEALCYETLADPGNTNPIQACVSVASFDGQPVLGLTIGNFRVYSLAGETPTVPWQVEIVDLHYNGFVHTLLVKPKTEYTAYWGSGPYIFAVEVTEGFRSGRTLTTVTIN